VEGFQRELGNAGLKAALIIQKADLYYFAGTAHLTYFLIPAEGEPVAISSYPPPDPLPWRTVCLNLGEPLGPILAETVPSGGTVGLELDVLPVKLYERLAKALPGHSFADVSAAIRRQRSVKSAWEAEVLRETARKDAAIWSAVPELLARSQTDLELAAAIEKLARTQGHQGLIKCRAFNEDIFLVGVLVGAAGARPGPWDSPLSGMGVSPLFPQGACGARLEAGVPILIDHGGCYYGYILDQSRLFAIGHLPPEARRAYEVARRIQDAVVDEARPGVTCGRLYDVALKLAEEAGLKDYFMGPKRVPYIGHGVGLELDEWPVLARSSSVLLQPGMVFALEPKFALPGLGAVGLENCFLVTEDGVERLTSADDELKIVNL
jgi:Xaa-Pro aminopeptidase